MEAYMNIIEALKSKNMTISTAESLTAGLVASNICSISGASNYFKGGVVAYIKEIKCNLLGLKMADIEKYSVYSNETVSSMASGVMRLTNSDIAIATSGVAGPGDDEGVKAGTVYFCIKIKDKKYLFKELFTGDRNTVRENASRFVIDKTIKLLNEN